LYQQLYIKDCVVDRKRIKRIEEVQPVIMRNPKMSLIFEEAIKKSIYDDYLRINDPPPQPVHIKNVKP